jgi:hypothetical protein
MAENDDDTDFKTIHTKRGRYRDLLLDLRHGVSGNHSAAVRSKDWGCKAML